MESHDLLGSVSDPNATNWYNFASINSSGQPAWAGTSNGWVKSTYLLQQVLGQNNVQFRYIFLRVMLACKHKVSALMISASRSCRILMQNLYIPTLTVLLSSQRNERLYIFLIKQRITDL
ncbi:MAG: hypothetical protein IPM91_11380 [Bacteroidetes bacterium]|nr:hypothetical protein [Bacteroidota bacterium]